MKKNFLNYLTVPQFTIVVFAIFALGIFFGQNFKFSTSSQNISFVGKEPPKNVTADFSLFWEIYDRIQKDYIETESFDSQKILYGAIGGMLNSLGDPYTSFFTPEENMTFSDEMKGIYEGVGIQLGYRNDKLVVMSPLSGTPAQRMGIKAGDVILQIGDKDTKGIALSEAVSLIRGKHDTDIKLTISREGVDKPFDVTLTRERIVVKSVEIEWKDSIAYLKVTRFGEDTIDEWNKAVEGIVREGSGGVILDLRNNPGGQLGVSISIASEFFQRGKVIVSQEGRQGKNTYRSDKDGRLKDYPLVVLINKGSASASEIVAAAIKENDRGEIIGETSFGKGTVQEVVDFEDDGSALHLTTSKWLTPDGNFLKDKGLEPDVEVELTQEDVNAGRDPQLDRALEMLK